MPRKRTSGGILLAVAAVFLLSRSSRASNAAPAIPEAMPILPDAIAAKINTLAPAAKPVFARFLFDVLHDLGFTPIITSAYRSFEQQQVLFNKGDTKTPPGYSFHNYGMALDLNFAKGSTYLNLSSPKQQWIHSGIPTLATEYNIRWGGDFSTPDKVHFDLGNDYNINDLFAAVSQ